MGKNNARKDAHRDMGSPSTACTHPAPWNSRGPTTDHTGRSCTIYSCNECGKTTRTHYY